MVEQPVENLHQPFRRRERAMLRFRRMRSLQKFAAVHATVHNHHLTRSAALKIGAGRKDSTNGILNATAQRKIT